MPVTLTFDVARAEAVERATPEGKRCAGEVTAVDVPAELRLLDWVTAWDEPVEVVTEARSGWHGGHLDWEHNVWLGFVDHRLPAGEPEVALYRALFGVEPPDTLEGVRVGIEGLRGGFVTVSFDVGEADVPADSQGTCHLEPTGAP